ncbi:hypothetical protein [Luteolibacter soli]|uniref:Secreted protein n=1 Tax=Luteolibacter soli TaxID=3135280 RepID=A0ABU9AUI7_9BACT
MNRLFLFATLIVSQILPLAADSGGPYLAVPDAAESEKGPVFQIPREEKPLRHFLTHMPEFQINQKLQEPESYTWKPLAGYYAALSSLGHDPRGQELLCIRYVSDKNIDLGLVFAESILIVTRKNDPGPEPKLCIPVLYATAFPGLHYDWTANDLKSERSGSFKITGFIGGTGHFLTEIFIRWQDGKFVRFEPKAPAEPDAASSEADDSKDPSE